MQVAGAAQSERKYGAGPQPRGSHDRIIAQLQEDNDRITDRHLGQKKQEKWTAKARGNAPNTIYIYLPLSTTLAS